MLDRKTSPQPSPVGEGDEILRSKRRRICFLWGGQAAGARRDGIPGAAGFVEDVVDPTDDVSQSHRTTTLPVSPAKQVSQPTQRLGITAGFIEDVVDGGDDVR